MQTSSQSCPLDPPPNLYEVRQVLSKLEFAIYDGICSLPRGTLVSSDVYEKARALEAVVWARVRHMRENKR